MADLWEPAFAKNQKMWGEQPTTSARRTCTLFASHGVERVLIPGFGYGRNAQPFVDAGMSVVGIEISQTAISLARSTMGLQIPIHHGSVTDMPFDDLSYGGIFCFGLLYLLDAPGRRKLLADCAAQLQPGSHMVFTLISKAAPMYGRGVQLGEDWFENPPGMRLFFYDEHSVERELGPFGLVECVELEESAAGGPGLPFLHVVCRP